MVKERPILMSVPMLRAILAGRKTVTRRIVKWPLRGPSDGRKRRLYTSKDLSRELDAMLELCPYGQPGGRLWVKSKWLITDLFIDPRHWPRAPGDTWVYHGKAKPEHASHVRYAAEFSPMLEENFTGAYRSSLLMPRWASKLTLVVKSVRIEPLHKMNRSEAQREGFVDLAEFQELWSQLNAKRKGCEYSDNPYVWRVEFEMEKASE